MLITFVRHGNSCGNASPWVNLDSFSNLFPRLNHPVLTNLGVAQSILLGQYIMNQQDEYDLCFCSPSIRTIMTALLALRDNYYTNKKLKIEINPYITEKNKLLKWYFRPLSYVITDKQNHMVNPSDLKQMIILVKNWLDECWLFDYDDIMFEELVTQSDNIELKEKYKELQQQIKDANKHDMIKTFKTYLHNNTNLPQNIRRFGDSTFLRGCDIDMSEYESLYDSIKGNDFFTDGFVSTQYFLDAMKKRIYKHAIVFSHSNILKHFFKNIFKKFFKDYSFFWNTDFESILDKDPTHLNKLFNTSAFTLSDTNLKAYYPKVNTPEREKFNSISKKYKKANDVIDCMKPESLNQEINMLDKTTSKYMKNGENKSSRQEIFFYKKYLLYKQKYIKLKKIMKL